MPTEQGYNNQKKLGKAQFKTIHALGSDSYGPKVAQACLYEKKAASAIVSVDTIYSASGTPEFYEIEITAHGASVGDVMRMTSGNADAFNFEIQKIISANKFYILPLATPAVADTAEILGWTITKTTKDGTTIVTVSAAPVQFVKNGVDTEVEEDTVDQTNSEALPTALIDNVSGQKMQILDNPNTVRQELQVHDEEQLQFLGTIDSSLSAMAQIVKDVNTVAPTFAALMGMQEGLNMVAVKAGQRASANSLATVLSTEQELILSNIKTNLDTILTRNPAALGQLLMAASLSVTIASDQTAIPVSGPLTDAQLRASAVPVSLAALPLPTGGATEAKQDTGNTSLSSIDGKFTTLNAKDFATETTLSAMSAKLPATLGQKASASSLSAVLSTEQEALINDIKSNTAKKALDSMSQSATTTSATLTAPANTKGFTIQNSTRATGALRFTKTGGGASASVGFLLEPGQSTSYQEGASSLDVFAVDGTAIDACVIWYV